MHYPLKLHPDFTCPAITGIDVAATRPAATTLHINYTVSGDIGAIDMVPVGPTTRGFELWRKTCFELFIRLPNDTAYYEFNFAPSTEWTVHHLTGRRTGATVAEEIAAPRIDIKAGANRYEYSVMIDVAGSTLAKSDTAWQLAIATYIKETSGNESFWALYHAPGHRDFHNPDNFICTLLPPTT